MAKFMSFPVHLDLGKKGLNFERADIRLKGIEQAGSSFEGRVFLNNPEANEKTLTTEENGYAGAFHVYGFGLSPEEMGKENVGENSPAARAPIEKVVIASEAVRRAASRSKNVVVTVVPVYAESALKFASNSLTLQSADIIIS